MSGTKSFNISEAQIWKAYQKVKANKGAAGIDNQSIKDFEKNLKSNLYKIRNRMASGTYFPPAVKAVEIPKGDKGVRLLGIPTVSDRIAQMVAKLYIEPSIDRCFHRDSYGYRPEKSAEQALEVTRQRCWKYDWVIDLDVKGFFDNMNHELMLKALKHHIKEKWILLYVERWLKAPMIKNEEKTERTKGTPQGGVISPLLANLFMHYAFDKWMDRKYPQNPFARYADDAVIHCKTKQEAEILLAALRERMQECFLELHSEKTVIVYCKDGKRKDEDHDQIIFDFLGYTFRPRCSRTKRGKVFLNFSPAVSGKAKVKIKDQIKKWKLPSRTGLKLEDIAEKINPQVRGWINYYGKFYQSALYHLMGYIEYKLCLWARKKYKRFNGRREKAREWLTKIRQRQIRGLFVHWKFCP